MRETGSRQAHVPKTLSDLCVKTPEPDLRPLDRLAERCGIEPEFRDAGGTLRRPSAAVKRRLIAAMGIRVERSADAERALADIDRDEWTRPVRPTVVK